jgi:hypothetical protein
MNIMKFLIFILMIVILSHTSNRVYRQEKSVYVHQTGKVVESANPGDLFEISLYIDSDNSKIYKTKVKRMDWEKAINTNKVYTIRNDRHLIGSYMGDGGKTIIAISDSDDETLEIGEEFLFSSKGSTFSQRITGIFRRIK